MSRRRSGSRWNLLPTPPPWANGVLVLYHGTVAMSAQDIIQNGVNVQFGRRNTDFGRGFYTTTSLPAAQDWARDMANWFPFRKNHAEPAVVQFEVDRELLVQLASLSFVRGDQAADDYWSFVWHSRQGAGDHGRPINNGWYDVVYGPVAANYRARTVVDGIDQISFHTVQGQAFLNASNPHVVP